MDRKQESLHKYEVYCPVCGATWKRKTRCKLVRDSDLFYCKRCEVELKVRLIDWRKINHMTDKERYEELYKKYNILCEEYRELREAYEELLRDYMCYEYEMGCDDYE